MQKDNIIIMMCLWVHWITRIYCKICWNVRFQSHENSSHFLKIIFILLFNSSKVKLFSSKIFRLVWILGGNVKPMYNCENKTKQNNKRKQTATTVLSSSFAKPFPTPLIVLNNIFLKMFISTSSPIRNLNIEALQSSVSHPVIFYSFNSYPIL